MARLDVQPDNDLWRKFSNWVTKQRNQYIPDMPGGAPVGEILQSLLVPENASSALQATLQPMGMARAPKKMTPAMVLKRIEQEPWHFPSRKSDVMLPPEMQSQYEVPYLRLPESNAADIGDILGNYQQSTQDALKFMRSTPAAKELGYKEGESIPRNLRNIRNNAILRDDTRAMSTNDLPKRRIGKLAPETEKEISDFVDRYNGIPPLTGSDLEKMRKMEKAASKEKMRRENLMRGEEEDMINAGEIPWNFGEVLEPPQRPTNFLNEREGPFRPSSEINEHLRSLADQLPPTQDFLDRTQIHRTGERAASLYDFLTEHRANRMSMDDPMVRDMLEQFDRPRTTAPPRVRPMEQGALPFYDRDARDALMDFYNKSQRYTPTTPLKRGERQLPTPEGGNAPYRDFRNGYLDVPDVQLPGIKEPIGVRRYDTAEEGPLPSFMLKHTKDEVSKPFVFDLNSPKTFDEILNELMNSKFTLPPGVR